MIISVANTKGGVGKTVIALNIAVARALQGIDVWLVDGDRQGTAQTAIGLRAEAAVQPAIACSSYSEGAQLRSQIHQQKSKFADVIIDVGGRDSSALRAALIVSDLVLVPFQPRSYDVWALRDIAQLIGEARGMRDGLRAYAVLNCADPSGSDNREAAEAVAEYPELLLLDTPLHRRKAFANAAGAGLCVTELKPRDERAVAEFHRLMDHLFVTEDHAEIGDLSVISGDRAVT